MSNANEGAFPQPHFTNGNGDTQFGGPGLTKRELFAAMAMQGMLSDSIPGSLRHNSSVGVAAVHYADALLAALAKEPQP